MSEPEGDEAARLAGLAADWIALWQGELAAMAADPELLAAVAGWSAAGAEWARAWAAAARPPAPGWPGAAPPFAGLPASWPGAGWPMPPPPAPPAPAPGGHDPAPRPAPAAPAPDAGGRPGLDGDGGDPLDDLRDRIARMERELAGLRAAVRGGPRRVEPDPGRPAGEGPTGERRSRRRD